MNSLMQLVMGIFAAIMYVLLAMLWTLCMFAFFYFVYNVLAELLL